LHKYSLQILRFKVKIFAKVQFILKSAKIRNFYKIKNFIKILLFSAGVQKIGGLKAQGEIFNFENKNTCRSDKINPFNSSNFNARKKTMKNVLKAYFFDLKIKYYFC
jgi:hypothetical protein